MAIPYIQDDEFDLVSETRGKLQFDEDGDIFIGTWEGFETITDPNTSEEYVYCNFRNAEFGAVAVSASYQLKQHMEKVPVPSRVRITRTGSTEMKKGNPMIHFRIEVAKPKPETVPFVKPETVKVLPGSSAKVE